MNQENSSNSEQIKTDFSKEDNQTETNPSSEIESHKNQRISDLEADLASVNEKLLRALAENDNLRKSQSSDLSFR